MAGINLMIISDLDYNSIKSTVGSILGNLPKVISRAIIQTVLLTIFGFIALVLTYIFTKEKKANINTLDEDLLDDETVSNGRAE